MKDKLLELLKIKPYRYISKEFLISKTSKEFYISLIQSTSFLDEDSKLSLRIFCVINDITSYPNCLKCNKKITKEPTTFVNLTAQDYTNQFCSSECFNSYQYDINSIVNTTLDKEFLLQKINTLKTTIILRKPYLMDMCKLYLKTLNINYSKLKLDEMIYFIKNNLKDIPKCYCGNNLNYINSGRYHKYCSQNCNVQSNETKNKRISTLLTKYGTTNVSFNEDVLKKIKLTNLKKYGVDNYTKTEEYRKRIQSGDIKRRQPDYEMIKIKNKRKFYDSLFTERLEGKFKPLFTFEEFIGVGIKRYPFECLKCGEKTESRIDDGSLPRCPICEPFLDSGGQSKIESDFLNFIKNAYNNEVSSRNRDIITPYELDVLIKDKNLAFEVNGLYWHSEKQGKGRLYHLYKTKLCNEKGIRLIQIYEDEWLNKTSIVKDKIKSLLGLIKNKVYARECEVRLISESEKNKFLNKHHIQGEDRCNIKLGLFKGKHLVSVMTFSKLRKALGGLHKENHWELSRFASLRKVSVIGAAGKLLKYFETNYKPEYIKTYADKRWSKGDLYYKLGFKLERESFPSYYYMDNTYKVRYHRFKFRKNTLKTQLVQYNDFDSEWKNMKNNGYDRIWYCGHYVFTKTYK